MNNFQDDSRIVDYWRFENNLLAGKAGNDLTAGHGTSGYNDPPEYDSGVRKEGDYSLYTRTGSPDYKDMSAGREDVDLSAGFPLKSGDAVKKFSWAFWVWPKNMAGGYLGPVSKYGPTTPLKTFIIQQDWTATGWMFNWATGVTAETWTFVSGLSSQQWYHIGVAADGIAKTCTVRFWNDVTRVAATYTHTFTAELYIGSPAPAFMVVNRSNDAYCWPGKLDELVVANDLLSVAEFDLIRKGHFGITAPTLFPIPTFNPDTW